jgi:hypothetical protein
VSRKSTANLSLTAGARLGSKANPSLTVGARLGSKANLSLTAGARLGSKANLSLTAGARLGSKANPSLTVGARSWSRRSLLMVDTESQLDVGSGLRFPDGSKFACLPRVGPGSMLNGWAGGARSPGGFRWVKVVAAARVPGHRTAFLCLPRSAGAVRARARRLPPLRLRPVGAARRGVVRHSLSPAPSRSRCTR